MNKEMLHILRIVVPGLVLLLVLIPLFQPNMDTEGFLKINISKDSVVYTIAIFVFGGVYYMFNLRQYVMRKPLEKVQENIKQGLLEPFAKIQKVESLAPKLREGRILLDIFYSFVDNDNSLKEQAKEVYLNGLIWSTVADVRVISLFAFVTYLTAWGITQNLQYLNFTVIWVAVFVVTFILMPLITKRHIELSNAQLGFIILNYKKELQSKLLKAIK